VAPPGRRAAQAHQPRGLGRHAVDRHELLLLANSVEEAQRVRAEPDHPDGRERREAHERAAGNRHALSRARGREQQERQHQPRGHLDPDAGDERGCGGAEARAGPGGQCQRGGEHHHDQGVVVRAADGEHEQHRVQAHERRCPAPRVTQQTGRARDHRHGGEAREYGERLERPQSSGEPQGRGRVAREREKGAVGGMLQRPSDEAENRIGGRFGGHMRVGVQAVQGSQTGEAEVAEHVAGYQRRAEQQDHVRGHDGAHERARRQRSRGDQHDEVAPGHDQHQRLEAVRGDADVKALERAGQPPGPAAGASRHVLRGSRRGTGAQQEHARDGREQAEHAEHAQGDSRPSGAWIARACRARSAMPGAAAEDVRYRGRGLHGPIVASAPGASVSRAR
jgi:hypothetical protein